MTNTDTADYLATAMQTAELARAGSELVRITVNTCLLYTSDAADERSSVDLGGRRIIKKKKKERVGCVTKKSRESRRTRDTNEHKGEKKHKE